MSFLIQDGAASKSALSALLTFVPPSLFAMSLLLGFARGPRGFGALARALLGRFSEDSDERQRVAAHMRWIARMLLWGSAAFGAVTWSCMLFVPYNDIPTCILNWSTMEFLRFGVTYAVAFGALVLLSRAESSKAEVRRPLFSWIDNCALVVLHLSAVVFWLSSRMSGHDRSLLFPDWGHLSARLVLVSSALIFLAGWWSHRTSTRASSLAARIRPLLATGVLIAIYQQIGVVNHIAVVEGDPSRPEIETLMLALAGNMLWVLLISVALGFGFGVVGRRFATANA